MSTFARFPPRLQEAIVSRLGWTSLRPVQELAGAAILDGKNAVVLAPTAGVIGVWKAVDDNFALRIEGDGASHATVEAALAKMGEAGFWENGETRTTIRARVPPFRLSKFQRALPPEAETEFVARSFLDFEGAAKFLG